MCVPRCQDQKNEQSACTVYITS